MTQKKKNGKTTSVKVELSEPFGDSTIEDLEDISRIVLIDGLILFEESDRVSPCEVTAYPIDHIIKMTYRKD